MPCPYKCCTTEIHRYLVNSFVISAGFLRNPLVMPDVMSAGGVSAGTVTACAVTRCPVVVGRFVNRYGWRVPQIRAEHQDERRDDAEGKKRVERRKDGAQVSARIDRQPPRNGPRSKPTERGNCPRPGSNFKARVALGAVDAKRISGNV